MTRHDDRDDAALDRLLAEAQAFRPAAPDDLMARIMADAAAALPRPLPQSVPHPAPQQSLWQGLLAAIGGWPTMGGLATAMAAGLWIGAAPTGPVWTWAASVAGDTLTVDILATDDPFGLTGG